jgi:O-antigen ligase
MSPVAEYATPRDVAPSRRVPWDLDTQALSAWALSLALVLYLAVDGGGYAFATHSQVGIVVWWLVVISAAWGLLPVRRLTKMAKTALGLFAAFTAWTAIGITWSISSGRSFQDLALVTCYLGILVLAVSIHRERGEAVRHTTAAVATAIAAVAALALAARLWPGLFPSSRVTSQIVGGSQSRLLWPLNYWNAEAALMALGLPLLLAQATSARSLRMQALAAAAVPLVALCDALTLSRGGAIEAAVAVFVFVLLAPERIPKLATLAVTAAGSAVVVYGGLHRQAFRLGLTGSVPHHEAMTLLLALIPTCVGVGIAQAGVGLLTRHATLPRLLRVSPGRARVLTLMAVVLLIAGGLAAGAPHHLQHVWDDFKAPGTAVSPTSTSRFASAAGEDRYQYWVAAVDSAKAHVLNGSGSGTFQLDWLPRAHITNAYVMNAHSLYFETYAELGLVGVVVLVAFLISLVVGAIRVVIRSEYEERTRAAAVVAALAAFMVGAAFDWLWQMPVLPAAILLLVAAALAPGREQRAESQPTHGRRSGTMTQVVMVAAGLAGLVAIAYPLATNSDIAASQAAATVGNTPLALSDAQSAVRLEPGSGAAQLQLALVYESMRKYGQAVSVAKHAVADERENWSNWLILSRLEAENHNAHEALVAYLEAKSLNPHSPLFHES